MSFQQWRRQLRMTEALARIAQGDAAGAGGGRWVMPACRRFGAAFRETFGTTPAMVAPLPACVVWRRLSVRRPTSAAANLAAEAPASAPPVTRLRNQSAYRTRPPWGDGHKTKASTGRAQFFSLSGPKASERRPSRSPHPFPPRSASPVILALGVEVGHNSEDIRMIPPAQTVRAISKRK